MAGTLIDVEVSKENIKSRDEEKQVKDNYNTTRGVF